MTFSIWCAIFHDSFNGEWHTALAKCAGFQNFWSRPFGQIKENEKKDKKTDKTKQKNPLKQTNKKKTSQSVTSSHTLVITPKLAVGRVSDKKNIILICSSLIEM